MSDKDTIMMFCMIFLFIGLAYGVSLLIFMVGSMIVNWLSLKSQESK